MLRPDPRWILVLLFVGCVAGDLQIQNYGDMRPNSAVMKTFETYQADSNLVYYMSGPDTGPTGLMGIEKGYVLETKLWRRVEDPLPPFRELVRGMQSKALEYGLSLHGFDIRDDRGNDIGDWYSILDGRMPVKMVGEKRVMVYPPPSDIYEINRLRRFGIDED